MKSIDGCGIQCIAKVSGVSPTKVREISGRISRDGDFPDDKEVVKILKELGVEAKILLNTRINPFTKHIATVPSLNIKGGWHYIVVTMKQTAKTTKVWDPIPKNSLDEAGLKVKRWRYVSPSKRNLGEKEFRMYGNWCRLIQIK
jgi:hypothetical protein